MEGEDRTFRRNAGLLWAAQFISAMGDSVFLFSIAWLAGNDPKETGKVILLARLPFVLFAPLAGPLVDRFDHRRLMILSDLLRAALLIPLPWIVFRDGTIDFVWLGAVAFLLATLSTPFQPARDSLLPRLLAGRSLVRWNSAFQTSTQCALILGPVLGGVLMAQVSEGDARSILLLLQLDGATFVVSALCLAGIRMRGIREQIRHHAPLLREAVDGIRMALRDGVIRAVLILTAVNNLAIMGIAYVGHPLLFKKELGWKFEQLAWFEGCMAVGMLIGSILIARNAGRWSVGKLLLWGMVFDGVTYIPFLWAESYVLILGLILFHGLFIPMIVVGRVTLLQSHVPERSRGKIFALVYLTVEGASAAAAPIAGYLAHWFGTRELFVILGSIGMISGLAGIALLPAIREFRGTTHTPDETDDPE